MMVNDISQNDITAPVSSDRRYRETSPATSKLETRCLVQLQEVMKHHCSCCATPFTWRRNRRWSTSEAAFANTVAVLAMTLATSRKISLFWPCQQAPAFCLYHHHDDGLGMVGSSRLGARERSIRRM